ncbi:MAG: exonuclease SbcCD subunit D [Runella sp.]
MKILHTADWHLGKCLEQFSRLEEQREVLTEICTIAAQEAVDAVIVAGDLFDNFNPSSEAQQLLYSTLTQLSDFGRRAVVAIAGNHDSPDRIDAPDSLARELGILFVGFPNAQILPFSTSQGLQLTKSDKGFVELRLPNHTVPLRLLLTPYANEQRLRTYLQPEKSDESLRQVLQQHWRQIADAYCDNKGINILVTHLYVMQNGDENPPEEPDDERSILHIGGAQAIFTENFPPQIQYVALGHLHRFQTITQVPCPMVYSSSPLAYSFAEAHQTKNVVIVEAEPNERVNYRAVPLNSGRKLLKGRFEDIEQAIQWLNQNQNAYIQLTIVADRFLESADKKRLMEAHSGLMPIIPEIRSKNNSETIQQKVVDLQGRTVEELFIDYFKHKNNNQAPSESILQLLKEVLAQE